MTTADTDQRDRLGLPPTARRWLDEGIAKEHAVRELKRLNAEVARLRAALEEIAKERCACRWWGGKRVRCGVCIARAALEVKP